MQKSHLGINHYLIDGPQDSFEIESDVYFILGALSNNANNHQLKKYSRKEALLLLGVKMK